MTKNDSRFNEGEDPTQRQIQVLEDQGITYYYDRKERLKKKKRDARDTDEIVRKAYRYGLITIAIICVILLIIIWFKLKQGNVIEGPGVRVSFVFFLPEEGEEPSAPGEPSAYEKQVQIKLYLRAKTSPIFIDKGTVIEIELENDKGGLFEEKVEKKVEEKIEFPRDLTLYPQNPLPYLFQVSKDDFRQATHLRVTSRELGLAGVKALPSNKRQ